VLEHGLDVVSEEYILAVRVRKLRYPVHNVNDFIDLGAETVLNIAWAAKRQAHARLPIPLDIARRPHIQAEVVGVYVDCSERISSLLVKEVLVPDGLAGVSATAAKKYLLLLDVDLFINTLALEVAHLIHSRYCGNDCAVINIGVGESTTLWRVLLGDLIHAGEIRKGA
jgi:hypothetical protein